MTVNASRDDLFGKGPEDHNGDSLTSTASCLVDVHNEWDPLEEVVVGVADGARVPSADRGLFCLDYASYVRTSAEIPTGPHTDRVIKEAGEDLEIFVETLRGQGVTVKRPPTTDHSRSFGTPDWRTDGQFNYCPRDVLLTVGNTIIETPMPLRARYFESFAYRELVLDYFRSGANWIAAPKPRLPDESYNSTVTPGGSLLSDLEPLFDAANVIRAGRDLLYLVSSSGNTLGAEWLQRALGHEYRVHPIVGIYDGTHIDTTITFVRPGLVVLNPERIIEHEIPEILRGWDVIWCREPVDTGWCGPYPRSSIWQAMNFMMVIPELAIVNELQKPLIRDLERHRVEVMPLPMRQARTLSGGFHCVSLDIRRRGLAEEIL